MKPGRNDPCPCGSGKKFKQCCQQRETPASGGSRNAPAMAGVIQTALEHHRAGRLGQAEAIYRQVLQSDPDQPDALHYLGAIASQQDRHEAAIEFIGHAIRIRPSRSMHYNLGNALRALGRLEEAAASYRQALLLKPDYAEAHANLGNVLQAQDRLDEAISSYRKALAFKPDLPETHYNLGNALKAQGRLDEAAASYRRALALRPDHIEAHFNLGNVLYILGRLDETVASLRKVLALRPDHTEALTNMGLALVAQGKLEEAIGSYRQALALKPDYADAHNNLGNALAGQGNHGLAIEHYRKALALKPEYPEAYINLGSSLRNLGKLDEAAGIYRSALALWPDYADAYSNLLFLHAYHGTLGPEEYLALARGWELACLSPQERLATRNKTFQRAPLAGRRLKVGYMSGDYRKHPVSIFVEQLFAHHDRNRIELHAYPTCMIRDEITVRLQALTDCWTPVSALSDAALLDRIEADGIDVLIDLSGHTAYNRLPVLARRAAPVQAYYLGYFASTGLSGMDYWIGDAILTPPETDGHFSEQVWRLPRISMSYTGRPDAPLPGWRPDPDGTVWVGSFNSLGKITPATLALWASVLHALPGARLLLKTKELASPPNRQRILDDMAGHGIAAGRIELLDSSTTPGWAQHMAYYDRLDIALDPVGGHGGVTTTCDALWMAVPVVTLMGERVTSRMTASMLDAIGHPEWVTRSETEYVGKVAALARDVEGRKQLRAGQRARMAASPLCDARGLAEAMEDAYFEMFRRWQAKQGRQPSP